MSFYEGFGRFGDAVALIDETKQLSYKELDTLVETFGKTLPKQKQLIAIEASTSFATVVAYLGVLRFGHVALMLDISMPKGAKERILQTYKPNFVYDQTLKPFYGTTHTLYEDLALLLSTSGSTGDVKFVRLSYENLQSNCDSICEYLPLTKEDRSITSLPLSYSYGLSILHTHLQVGASLFVSDLSLMQKAFWEVFQRYEITNFNGVPYHYEMLKRLGFTKKNYPALRFFTQAGGKLHKELVKHFAQYAKERKKAFFVMYGQTEATARISYLPPEFTLEKPQSIGTAIPGGELFIENGELVYKGKNVMLGYAESLEDLSLGDTLGGVLYTGDLATKDDEGFFYITGRKKRFVKLQGKRISLDAIEQFAKTLTPTVVVGEDEKVVLLTTTHENIAKKVATHFHLFHKAVEQKTVEEFFYTPNGKVDYEKLKRSYL